ncbi:MAG TPA: hypothetical protein VG389_26590 [Myxococcota bacterium]|jgi:hypothetical protein|nr:hypothetical protein [Myxococcota bacterium]
MFDSARSAVLAGVALMAVGCRCGAGAGEPCQSASDCRAGLLCDPQTFTCQPADAGTPPADAADAAPGSDATPPSDAAPGTDAAPGSDATPPTSDATTPSSDATSPSSDATTPPSDASASGSDAASTSADAGGCTRPPIDPSSIDAMCLSDTDCPVGYVCQPFSGIILTQSCEVLCATDCDCPAGYSCMPRADKSGSWMECG